MALRRAWDRALHLLATRVSKVTFESYIRPIRPLSLHDGVLTLGVSSAFAREWLDKRHCALIRSVMEGVLGCALEVRLRVLAAEERLAPTAEAAQPAASGAPTKGAPTPGAPAARPRRARGPLPPPPGDVPTIAVSPRFTFENFVVGRSNRLAHAGAVAVGASPGSVYNPLFLYGGSGLGKTHLLHAIGNEAVERDPATRVAFVDGETFTIHFVSALRDRKTEEFRRYYRSVDIWLVDDIQFIASKEQTKEEFFHTFNALHQTGRQIVITSDRSPRELRALDERLRSRFECGLIADVSAPELETRIAIVERRCQVEGWEIPRPVVVHVAEAIRSNMRALEGAITKLVAYASIMRSTMSIEMAQSVLGEFFIDIPGGISGRKGVLPDTVIRAAADRFHTSVDAIKSPRRDKQVVVARQAAMFLCRQLSEIPLSQIGAAFGGRDHTTVQRAIARIEALLPQDRPLQAAIQDVRDSLED
ncbi:MAG: chromosomal replication initiator protein DnaA [Chthonomonadales bacterium]|nr:chromosomal replication initiator protein DnaA [Chthonomonadales bacterium]